MIVLITAPKSFNTGSLYEYLIDVKGLNISDPNPDGTDLYDGDSTKIVAFSINNPKNLSRENFTKFMREVLNGRRYYSMAVATGAVTIMAK